MHYGIGIELHAFFWNKIECEVEYRNYAKINNWIFVIRLRVMVNYSGLETILNKTIKERVAI